MTDDISTSWSEMQSEVSNQFFTIKDPRETSLEN